VARRFVLYFDLAWFFIFYKVKSYLDYNHLAADMETTSWRLIINAPAEGAWNMAVDEAILESTAGFQQPTTLRLYAWNPYCLSLGHAQTITDIDLDRLQASRWQLVRRPTGGKAILHANELTYCICASKKDPHVQGSVLESYQHLSQGLINAMQFVNLKAISEPHKSPAERNTTKPICFEIPSDYEITMHGKKIIGSAQARKKDGVLQHGAIPLFGDITRITQALSYSTEEERSQAAALLNERAAVLETFTAEKITWKKMAHALICGFENALGIKMTIGRLSDSERERAKQLMEEKYANDEWTKRL